MKYDTSTLILSTAEPAWEAKVVEIEGRFGIKRRSGLDSEGQFMIETTNPVVIDGMFIMLGQWPAPALVLSADSPPSASDSTPELTTSLTSTN